jgi:hypothetical protein
MNRELVDALAWALVHFVWQGAAIALAAFVTGHALRKRPPEARYAVYCGALLLMLAAPAATFVAVRVSSIGLPAGAAAMTAAVAPAVAPASFHAAAQAAPGINWLPVLVAAWLAGVALLTLRSLGGWILAQRLKVWKTSSAPASVLRAGERLREQLGQVAPVRADALGRARRLTAFIRADSIGSFPEAGPQLRSTSDPHPRRSDVATHIAAGAGAHGLSRPATEE